MKNKIGVLILGMLILAIFTGCQPKEDTTEVVVPEYPSDVIDWNLYSWQEEGEWMFSIVDRNGGYESFKQISADEVKLPGVDFLKEAVLHLPENSEVFWTEYIIPSTELPPNDLLYQILDYCNSVGVPVVVLN